MSNCSSKSIAPRHLTYYCMLLLLSHKPRDDTHMTSMKIVQFSGPTTHLSIYVQNYSTPWPWSSNFKRNPPPSPNDNQSVKRKQNPKMTIRSFLPSRFLDVFKTSCQQDSCKNVFKTSSRRPEDLLKTYWKYLEDVLPRPLKDVFAKMFSRLFQDVFKM